MVAYRRLKFQTFSLKVVVVAYERWSHTRSSRYGDLIWNINFYFGILENWLLRRAGRLRELVETGGSSVFVIEELKWFANNPFSALNLV